jgi:hypothetical protein
MRKIIYPDGLIIPTSLPDDFRPATGKEACGNCGMYSNRRSYCGVYNTPNVRDNWICNKWRQRFFKR